MRISDRSSPAVPEALLRSVAELVRDRTGLEFSDSSAGRLRSAVRVALQSAAENDPTALLALLEADPERVNAIAAAATVAESYFFREPAQFEWLRREALPALCKRSSADPLRAWCAGCASGEEPYSLAILLREMGNRRPVMIVGSDLSPECLERARRATYSDWAMRSAPEQVVSRWFTRDTNGFTLDASIRGSVKFVRHNLAADSFPPGESGFDAADLILCRNVLIYFDLRTVQRVLAQFLDVLSPDGWLLLGASDPPVASLMACEVVVTEAGLAYRRARASDGTPVIDRRPASAAPETDLRGDGPVKWRATPSASLAPEPPEAALVARYGARDFRGAVTAAEYLLREQPASEFAWLALVRSLANLGEFAEAGRTNALAIERCPLSAELTYLAAVIQSHAGQHAQAADSARRALYLDHTLVVAHVALGAALASLGDRKDARRATGNAMRLLEGMDAGDAVPGADGETAGVMLALVRAERRLSGPPDGSADTA